MSAFDIIVIALLAVSAFFGFRKGLIMQLFGLVAIIAGVFCAFKFSELVSGWIVKWIDVDGVALSVISFIVIVLAVWIGVILLARVITAMFKITVLGMFNHLLGALFAMLQSFFIISAIVYSLSFWNVEDNAITKSIKESKSYEPMKRTAEVVFPYIDFSKIKDLI